MWLCEKNDMHNLREFSALKYTALRSHELAYFGINQSKFGIWMTPSHKFLEISKSYLIIFESC